LGIKPEKRGISKESPTMSQILEREKKGEKNARRLY